ncbi:MAG: hypothetical protein HYZ57_10560 [Acidobacteria bacterium]|nr:hypothetical protein [Acidobacteriota bacterium]
MLQRGAVLLPFAVCLALYWYGLKVWFVNDDFAWLGLRLTIHSTDDFWRALFSPLAQGTIRPLSERGFFLLFENLFGFDALPYRIWVFLTQFANLALVIALVSRLTRSLAAGVLAASFWTVNSALATPMSWTSSYNQILCAFFMLLSFWLWLRHIETGRMRYYWAQFATFLLGFGALEINIVYPAIAAAYAALGARNHLWKTGPLMAVSAVYLVVHNLVSPKTQAGVYGMYLDASMLTTLGTYWTWAAGAIRLREIGWGPVWLLGIATAALLLGLACFVWQQARARGWLAVFFVLWFLIVIAPFLPLREHVSDYYLTVPLIGLAMLGGWAVAEAWRRGGWRRGIAVVLATLYVVLSVPLAHKTVRWQYERSRAMRNLFGGVARAQELHPGKIILLKGVSSELFWAGFVDDAFRLLGDTRVYLLPGSEAVVEAHPELGDISESVLPESLTVRALEKHSAVVYEASGERLRNVTAVFKHRARQLWKAGLSPRVDAGQELCAEQFGAGWYPVEQGYRWMSRRAVVRLGGAAAVGQRLFLSGFAPEELLRAGPVRVAVSANGVALTTFALGPGDNRFERWAELPAWASRQTILELTLDVDRAYIPPADGRELTLAFGTLGIR